MAPGSNLSSRGAGSHDATTCASPPAARPRPGRRDKPSTTSPMRMTSGVTRATPMPSSTTSRAWTPDGRPTSRAVAFPLSASASSRASSTRRSWRTRFEESCLPYHGLRGTTGYKSITLTVPKEVSLFAEGHREEAKAAINAAIKQALDRAFRWLPLLRCRRHPHPQPSRGDPLPRACPGRKVRADDRDRPHRSP